MSASRGSIPLHRWWRQAGRWIALILALVAVGFVHVQIGRLLIAQTSGRTPDAREQEHLGLALQTRDDLSPDFSKGVTEPLKNWFPHRTDGVINPLWPWMAAWLVDKDHAAPGDAKASEGERALLNRGRWFHVGWSLGILVVVGLACARVFSLGGTLNVVLLTGFGALLPRCAYFEPEPVYFVLFLVTWVACAFALHKNSLWMHVLIGFFGGLAYLASESVLPLLLVYALASTLRWAWGWIEARWPHPEGSTTLWLRRNHWIALFLMAFCFLMTAGPRLSYADKTYGSPFHSLPAIGIWLDNPEDGRAWMETHETQERLEAEPKELRPSFKNYAATHTRDQMRHRLIKGTRAQVLGLLWPDRQAADEKTPTGRLDRRGVYLGWLVLALAVLAAVVSLACPRPINAAQRLHPECAAHILFVLGTVAVYSLVYGWYAAIDPGEQGMLSLYAPMVICVIWASESLLRRARRRNASPWIFHSYHIAQWLLIAAVSWDLFQILRSPVLRG